MSTDLHWALDWIDLRRCLLALMQEVGAEISAYPGPITACDAQFNHLLELRRMLPAELARLEAATADPSASAEDFIRSSPCREALPVLKPASRA
jgi:hypothetical protein